MTGMLFVTSAKSDFKQLNRLLVYLRDWEYGSFDSFHLVTTKEPQDLNKPGEGFGYPHDVEPTHPGLDADPPNAWKGSSITAVEEYVLRVADDSGPKGVNTSIYLLWDDRGVEEHSVIVGERRFDGDSDELTNEFDKLRCPWDCAYSMWCNLDIVGKISSDMAQWRAANISLRRRTWILRTLPIKMWDGTRMDGTNIA